MSSTKTIEGDEYHHVLSTDSISDGEKVIVDIEGREISIFRSGGEYYALANWCPHQGGPVCEGMLAGTLSCDEDFNLTYDREDEIVSCPWHGWEFDIKTGTHLANTKYRVPTYDVAIEDGGVFVSIY